MKFGKWGSVVIVIAVVFLLARCGQKTDPPSGTFGSVFVAIQNNNCVECHKPTGAAKIDSAVDLDFTTKELAFAGLSTKSVTGFTSAGICGGVKIVTAGDATKSYLAGTLFTDYNINNFAGKAGCKPYNGHTANPSAAQKTSILDWIKNGAKND